MEHTCTFAKGDLQKFFQCLEKFGKVQASVGVSDQSFAYKQVDSAGEIAFEALRTILPAKKFFYLPQEALLRYEGEDIEEVKPETTPMVLFGVHPCELAGFAVLDKILTAAPGDPHYAARRQSILIVGLSCMPDKHCFCQAMGTDKVTNGYDLFLTDIGDRYFVQVHTPAGASLLESADFLTEAQIPDTESYKHFWQKRSQAFTIGSDATNLRPVMDMEWDNPLWEELGQRCLSCGNCTPVCPTCYCFDLVDISYLNGTSGERRREWDSCQFAGFAKVAGEYNFRPGPVDRLKFWYRHKLHGFDDAAGIPTCVGCGRCTVSCPAGIDDIVGVALKLSSTAREGDK